MFPLPAAQRSRRTGSRADRLTAGSRAWLPNGPRWSDANPPPVEESATPPSIAERREVVLADLSSCVRARRRVLNSAVLESDRGSDVASVRRPPRPRSCSLFLNDRRRRPLRRWRRHCSAGIPHGHVWVRAASRRLGSGSANAGETRRASSSDRRRRDDEHPQSGDRLAEAPPAAFAGARATAVRLSVTSCVRSPSTGQENLMRTSFLLIHSTEALTAFAPAAIAPAEGSGSTVAVARAATDFAAPSTSSFLSDPQIAAIVVSCESGRHRRSRAPARGIEERGSEEVRAAPEHRSLLCQQAARHRDEGWSGLR